MSTPTPTTGVCAECDDSELSVASNVLGILTFAIAFLASCLAFLVATRGASKEIKNLGESLQQTSKHIEQIDKYFEIFNIRADRDLAPMDELITKSLRAFKAALMDMENEYKKYESNTLLRHFLWWYRENDIAAGMNKLDSHKQHFSAIQLTFLLR